MRTVWCVLPARAYGGCLADRTDEGRLRLRYASGSRQQGFDPRISEWGNPPAVMGRYRRVRGVRREVKHLSTCRKGYSVSSGERKRIRPNLARVIPVGGWRAGCRGIAFAGSDGPAVSCIKPCARGTGVEYRAAEGEGPVPERAWSGDRVSQVARAPWNPVRICPDRGISLNIPV